MIVFGKIRTKKKFEKDSNDNVDRLVKTMEKLTYAEPEAEVLRPKATGGSTNAWSYEEKKKKPKTFKL